MIQVLEALSLEMGISHRLQEYWCHPMRHLQLCFLGVGNNLLNSDFKGMNNAEREKLKTNCHGLIRCCTHMQLLLISSKTMILEVPWLFLSKFQLHFHFWCSATAFFFACMHMHLFKWHEACLHGSNMPVAVGESTSLHLITFSEKNCQNGQKQLQGLRTCCVSLISYLTWATYKGCYKEDENYLFFSPG